MSQLILRSAQVGPYQMNSYALIDADSGQSVLFDPGGDPPRLSALLAGSQPIAIILTHTHYDHVLALAEMRAALNVPVWLHPGPHDNGEAIVGDGWLNDGDHVALGAQRLLVQHAPGHIGNQICLKAVDQPLAIVGDTIFAGGPGRTWSADGLRRSQQTLRDVVLAWPDATVCHPGHGPSFRLGDLRAQVAAFAARDFGPFFGDATWEM